MKKTLILIIIVFGFWNCSSSKDTSTLTHEQHLEYAKQLMTDEDYDEAIREFKSVIMQYSGTPVNDDAQYFLAFTYFKKEQYLLAVYEFSKLIRDITTSEYVQDAQYMLAESYYQLSPNYQLEQSYTKKAVEEFQNFIEYFPLHPKVTEAEKKIDELYAKFAAKEFNNAEIYEKMEYYKAAIDYYKNIKDTYHDSKYAPIAQYRLIKLLVERDRNDEALRNIAEYIKNFPNDKNVSELKDLNNELINF